MQQQQAPRNQRALVVDVGAGGASMYREWITRFPRLQMHAIQPHPKAYEDLMKIKQKLDTEPATAGRLHVHRFVVSDRDTDAIPFHLANDVSSSSTLPFTSNVRKWRYPMGRRLLRTERIVEIPAKRLDTFFKQQSIGPIDLLNIDTQGDAKPILDGMSQRDWDRVRELNVKVHSIEWELYAGQSVNYEVTDKCRRHYLLLKDCRHVSRGQEDVLSFRNELAEGRGVQFRGWAKRMMDQRPY
jgi:FkbM family methyltransferase